MERWLGSLGPFTGHFCLNTFINVGLASSQGWRGFFCGSHSFICPGVCLVLWVPEFKSAPPSRASQTGKNGLAIVPPYSVIPTNPSGPSMIFRLLSPCDCPNLALTQLHLPVLQCIHSKPLQTSGKSPEWLGWEQKNLWSDF